MEVTVNDKGLMTLLNELPAKNIRTALKGTMRAGARAVTKGVRQQLVSDVHPERGWKKVSPSRDIKTRVFSKGGGFSVSLFDDRRKGGGTYILRFLSGGTGRRATNKGRYRGIVRATHFFRKGVEASIHRVAGTITDALHKQMARAYAKAKKA